MFNNQALAAKRKVTTAESTEALESARKCYGILSNILRGAIGTQSKQLLDAVKIPDVKKRRAALDVVSAAFIDECLARVKVSWDKYAEGSKKATASYGSAGKAQYDRGFMEQAIASSYAGRRFSDYEPFRADSMAAIAANGIYSAVVGTFFQAMGEIRDKAGDFGYYYALGDINSLTEMFVATQLVFLDKIDSWGIGGRKQAAGKPAANKKPGANKKPAAGKPAANKPAASGKPAANRKPATGKTAKVL